MNEGQTAFPFLAIFSLCAGIFAFYVYYTSVLPIAAYMVVDYHTASNLNTAGYAAGWIGGIFMLGRLLSAIPFGYLADHWGRKPCLVLSMITEGVLGIIFGFSTSYKQALIVRGLSGFANGFMTVLPIVTTELVDCKEHEIRAFGYANAANSCGFLFGSTVGGLLSRSAVQFPLVFSASSLWGQYPYLLPNLVCALFASAAAIMIMIWVPETKPFSLSHQDEIINLKPRRSYVQYSSIVTSIEVEISPRRSPQTMALVLTAFQLTLYSMMIKEIFPLWCVSSPVTGGLAWTPPQIVLVLAGVAVLLMTFQVFWYQPLMAMCQSTSLAMVLHYQLLGGALSIMLLPLSKLLPVTTFAVRYAAIVLIFAVHNVCIVSSYSALAILINGSVHPRERGRLNGYTATAFTMGNFAAPVVGSSLFAWLNDISTGGLLNGQLVFGLCGLLLILLALLVKRTITENNA